MVIFESNTNQRVQLVNNMKRMKAGLQARLRIFVLTIIGITGNIALGQSVVTISSISPTSAIPGDTITVTGTGFATAANGYLDLSSAEANIISSTNTQVQFTVPGNAIPGPVMYTNLTTNFTVKSSEILNILGDTDSSYVFSPPCDIKGTSQSWGTGEFVQANSKNNTDVFASGTFSDFDKDGDLDFIKIQETVSGLTGSVLYIWKNNNTTNTFSSSKLLRVEKQVVEQAENVSIFDANADGKQDLIVTNGNSGAGGANTVSILLNDYTTSSYIFSTTFDLSLPHLDMIRTADMTDDGLEDIIGLRDDQDTIVIYENTTTVGAFTNFSIDQNDSTKLGITNSTGGNVTPYHIEVGDFNLDGRQDIVVSHSEGLQIFIRDASSTWSSIHISSTVAYGFIAVGDLNSDGKADIIVSPVSKSTSQSIYGYINAYTSGTLGASDFNTLNIPHSTTDHHSGVQRNYHLSLADVNWDGVMDIISSQLGGNNRADHWIIENRPDSSSGGFSFGSPIRINTHYYSIEGNWPQYRHTFAADFNRDSVPDLVSFYRYGIEFQTNTVAREPGVLDVTQLKSLDDTAHCSSTTGDTLLFKVYVKGLKQDQEYANLLMQLPRFYKWKITYDSNPPSSWSNAYSYTNNKIIATPTSSSDTLFVWLLAENLGNLYGSTSSNLNTTRTETNKLKFYFQRINSNNLCRSPDPVETATFTNTWLGRPTEIFSRRSNGNNSHTVTCGHADSLEFKFTSPDSDTLLYQLWYRTAASNFPESYLSNYYYVDTITGYYDTIVASGDILRANYDSASSYDGRYTVYRALVTDENGCSNYTASANLWHRYWDNNNIQYINPTSVNAGDQMDIHPYYWTWHYNGPGQVYDDSITLNDVNVGPYLDYDSKLRITVPELPKDTVLGYNDTIKLYYHNPNPTEQCISSFIFEYKNTLVSGDSLSLAEMQWYDLLKGSMWDPYDDQTGNSSEIDLVGNDSNALFQATYQDLYDSDEGKFSEHVFFRARLGDSTFNDGLLWIGLSVTSDMEIDTYLRVDLANYTISLHDTIQTSSTFNNTPNQLNINSNASGTLTGTNNYYISLYGAATDLDQNGQEDSWLEIGFDLDEFNRFKSLNMTDASAISVFTSDTAQNNYDYAGFDDQSELDKTWEEVGALTIGTMDEFTSGKTLAPYDIFNSNQLKDYSSDTMYIEGVWGGHMGEDEDTIYFTWNNQVYTIDSNNVVIDQHKWRFYIYDWQVSCQFANGETRSLQIRTKDKSDANYRYDAVSISKYAGTGSLATLSSAEDGFETGTIPNPDLWGNFGTAANIYGNNNDPCGDAISGYFALHLYGDPSQRWFETKPLNLIDGGNIEYKVAQGYCETADYGEGVQLAYSTNGGNTWTYFYGQNPPSGYAYQAYSAPIPSAARTASTMIKFYQVGGCGTTCDNLIIDDIAFPIVVDSLVSPDTLTTYENTASEFVDFSVNFFNAQSSQFSSLSVDSAFITGQDSLDVTYLSGLPVILLAGQDVDVHFRFQPRHDTSRLRRDFILNIVSDGKEYNNICNSDSVTPIAKFGYARAIQDTVPPNIAVQPIILPLDSLGGAILYIEDVDIGTTDSNKFTMSLADTSFNCDDLGLNKVLFTAVDENGNKAYDTVYVTVVDNIAPWGVASDVTLYLDSSGTVPFDTAEVYQAFNDNCEATFNFTPQVFDCGDVGAHLSAVSGTDVAGNSTSIDFIINVKDSLLPWISLFTDTVELSPSGQGSLDTAAVIDYIRDNCGIQTIVFSDLDFSTANLGLNVISVAIRDQNNNEAVALTDIWVIDVIPPNVKAKDLVLPLNALGLADITASQVDDGSTDNIGFDTLYIDASGYDCSDLGDHWVVLTGVDKSGNSDTAWSKVTVVDNMKPEVDVINFTVYLDSLGHAALSFQDVDNGSTDNCGIDTTYLSKETFGCGDVGTSSNIAYATDSSGNKGSSVFLVTVMDTLAPSFSLSVDTIQLYTTTSCQGVGSWTYTVSDNCSGVAVNSNYNTGSTFSVGTTKVLTTATDQSGNSTSDSLFVLVTDTLPPFWVNYPFVTQTIPSLTSCGSNVSWYPASAVDYCGLVTITSNYNSGDFFTGPDTVLFTATDLSGNTITFSLPITISDQIPPVISPISDTTIYVDSNSCFASYSYPQVQASDNCGVDTSYFVPSTGQMSVGVNTVTLYVMDLYGNVSTESYQVTVEDNIPPMLVSGPNDTTLGSCNSIFSFPSPVFTDNCGVQSVSLITGGSSGNQFATGTTVNTYVAYDAQGNTDTFSFSITVLPSTAPVLPSYGFVCDTDPDFDLTGGDTNFVFYGGSYIQNNMFSPTTSGPGLHNINYSYFDSTGCTTYGNFAMSVSVGPAKPVVIRVTSTHLSTHQPYTSYQWFFNGNPIAGATSQTYQATVGGMYKVKVWNDGGCENISAPYFAGVVSTPEYTIHDLEIFPNPTTTDLVIDRKGYAMELDVELYSLSGKQLIESHYEGSEPIRLDMRDYPAGVYLLKLRTTEGVVRNQRIIVQH